MGEAIELTQQLYPGLLERDPNLLFMLKCRQFVEMVNGSDSEVRGPNSRSPRSHHSSGNGSTRSSPNMSPAHNVSGNASAPSSHILHHPLHAQQQHQPRPGSGSNSPNRAGGKHSRSSTPTSSSSSSHHSQQQHLSDNMHVASSEEIKNAANVSPQSSDRFTVNGSGGPMFIEGEENMDLSDGGVEDGLVTNGNYNPAVCMNGNSHPFDAAGDEAEDMGGLKSDALGKVLSFFFIFGWGF